MFGEVSLVPHRVDLPQVSDSILTEILDGIARCRLFLADITTIGALDGRHVRSANVMYEVGLAHASRLPEEVLLVRSDGDPLNFDVSNVRVNTYDPDGTPEAARAGLSEAIRSCLSEVELRRSLAVRRAAEALDPRAWLLLLQSRAGGALPYPEGADTVFGAIDESRRTQCLQTLLSAGALHTEFVRGTLAYRITPFGEAIAVYGLGVLGINEVLRCSHVHPLWPCGLPQLCLTFLLKRCSKTKTKKAAQQPLRSRLRRVGVQSERGVVST